MFDGMNKTKSEATYECLICGEIIKAKSYPGNCPECGGDIQNRANALE
ncbi:rubrerythrin-like domain-containing protein (plasmid) [Natrinema zhouii]|nr:rubrerythrin-like domain-containing protein [Natrinema zhouii]UHQ98420.1 rubrerythrin-like domain-containing protein [Natrinema zhouii]